MRYRAAELEGSRSRSTSASGAATYPCGMTAASGRSPITSVSVVTEPSVRHTQPTSAE